MEKTLANQRSGLDRCAETLHLSDDSRVLLEFAGEEHVFSSSEVRTWGEHHGVGVGWNLTECGDTWAEARMMLFGPEGVRCGGGACPVRSRE
jgi:hypothetical protein